MGKVLGAILRIGAIVVGSILGGPIGAAIGALVGTVAVSALGLDGGVPKPETGETAIKKPRPERVSAYGRLRLYGAYCLFETATDGTAVDVYAVHAGKMSNLVQRYLNDDKISVSGSSVIAGADGRFGGGNVSFYHTTGVVPGTAFSAVTALLPGDWTAAHRGDGIVTVAVLSKAVGAKDFQKIYPQSQPPIPSLVADWQACPDPSASDPLDESGWTYTERPVRHLLHYMLVREGPKPALPRSDAGYAAALAALRAEWWARNIAPTLSYWIAANAVCGEARTLKAGGTEAKYRACIAHKHTDRHDGVKGALLATFDGWMAPRSDGAIVIYAGKYYTPTVSIGADEIVSFTWDGGGIDDDAAVNELICSYVSAAHDYQTVDCDAWRDESDISERGRVLSQGLDPGVPSNAQVRFLAKRKMQRINAVNRGTVTTNIAGRIARGERYINLHIEEAGAVFYSGPAEITGLARSLSGGVTFEWVEADPNVDNWNPTTEEGERAPVGNRIASAALTTPVITTATPVFVGGAAYLDLSVTAPDRADLTWFAHWRVDGASVWGADLTYSDTDAGAPIALRVGPVTTGETIEVEVSYRVGDGRVSDWSAAQSASTVADLVYDGGAIT
jgi:hypothetical protein